MSEIPLTEIRHSLLQKHNVSLRLLREDLNHPIVGGNKWRKLKYNLAYAQSSNALGVVSMGGAFSNHLYALSAITNELGIKSIGLVREYEQQTNPTLDFIRSQGMDLQYVSRSRFRALREDSSELTKEFPGYFFIPEGGSNELAFEGCQEVGAFIPTDTTDVCIPVGTACTMAGLISGLENGANVIGFPALKENYLEQNILNYLGGSENNNWRLERGFTLGGIASYHQEFVDFLNQFYMDYGVGLDPIYNGKMIFGLFQMISNSTFNSGSNIVAVLTGGAQGIEGFNFRYGSLLNY